MMAKPGRATNALRLRLVLTDKVDDDGFELPFQFLPREHNVHDGAAREAGGGAVCWVEVQRAA
jgi:hypothetical protein